MTKSNQTSNNRLLPDISDEVSYVPSTDPFIHFYLHDRLGTWDDEKKDYVYRKYQKCTCCEQHIVGKFEDELV